jgi:polysaccharide export outer membrane protein
MGDALRSRGSGTLQIQGTPSGEYKGVVTLHGDEVFVQGMVTRPGAFSVPTSQPINVKQAIAAAGGVANDIPDLTVTVIRRDGDGDTNVVDGVPLASLFNGKVKDFALKPGDIIRVKGPPTGEYYIDGHVKRTGVYSLTGRKITLKQAIAAAGGLEGTVDAFIDVIRREDGRDWLEVKELQFTRLMSGEFKDIELHPNDIVRVHAPGFVPKQPATTKAATQASTKSARRGRDIDDVSPIIEADLKPAEHVYRAASGDKLEMSVTGVVGPGIETLKTATVSAAGNFSLPVVGAIRVAGLSVPEIEAAVEQAYRVANISTKARVTSASSERAPTCAILGSVARPGQYAITTTDFRLLDALAVAGARKSETSLLRVVRKADQRVLDINWDKLAAGDANQNVMIRPGDMVIVTMPQVGEYKIDGVVKRTGVYKLEGRKITLKQAVAAAGGIDGVADAIIHVERRGIGGVPVLMSDVLFSRLMTGDEKDIDLQPNDIVRVNAPEVAPKQPAATQAAPATRPAGDAAPVPDHPMAERIAAVDEPMREMLRTVDAMEFNLSRLRRSMGDNSRVVVDARRDVELQRRRIGVYVDEYLKVHPEPPLLVIRHWQPTILAMQQDELLRQLVNERETWNKQREETAKRLGERHPDLVALTQKLAEIDRMILERTGKFYADGLPAARIATLDATMAKYMREQAELSEKLETLRLRGLGDAHASVQAAKAGLEAQNRRIEEYAAGFRKQMMPASQPAGS